MAVTRIKNNQITDATIFANVKIAPGTIVGTLFNPDVTISSNIAIVGNLTVTGATNTINSINTLVNDPLVIFNNGYTGTPAYDVGILVDRNLQPISPTNYGGLNSAFIWREADGAFESILTTETGTTQGSINRTAYANVIVGNTVIRTGGTNASVVEAVDTATGALQVKGGASFTQNVQVGGTATVFGANTGQVAIDGNVSIVQITQLAANRYGLMITDTDNDGALAFKTNTADGALIQTFGGTNNDIKIQANRLTSLWIPSANGAVLADIGINSTTANVGSIVVTGAGGIGIGGNLNVGGPASISSKRLVLDATENSIVMTANTTTANVGVNSVIIGQGISPISVLGANTTVIGYQALNTADGDNVTAVGSRAGFTGPGDNTTLFGTDAGLLLQATATDNQFFGRNAGSKVTTGSYNVIIGTHDGNTIATLDNHVIISDGQATPRIEIDNTGNVWVVSSLDSTSTTTGALTVAGGVGISGNLNVSGNISINNLVFGGTGASSTGRIFIGKNILTNDIGVKSIVIGNDAGASGTGANATIVGDSAGASNPGVNNSLFGRTAGTALTGVNNTLIGWQTGRSLVAADNNTFVGQNAGSLATSADGSVIIGSYDGSGNPGRLVGFDTGANNIVISDGAGTVRVTVDGADGTTQITSTVQSDNVATAALIVEGGISAKKNVRIGGNLFVTGDMTVFGTVTTVDSTTLLIQDPTIAIGGGANNAVLISNDDKDRGLVLRYYDGADRNGFIGYDNSTQRFVYLLDATESAGNVFSGTLGTGQFGELIVSNTTVSSSQITGAVVVAGGVGIGGKLTANNAVIDNNLTASGENATITFSPTGTGSIIINPTTKGSIDNVTIGQSTDVEGTFTEFEVTANAVMDGSGTISMQPTGAITINPTAYGNMDNMFIGNTTPRQGNFTAVTVNQDLVLDAFTANSVLFLSPSGNVTVDQRNSHFNFQRLTGNTFSTVSLGLGYAAEADLLAQGTDTLNIRYQGDSYLPQSAVAANTVSQSMGWTTSTSRGTAVSPELVQNGDFNGVYGAYAWTGNATPSYQEIGSVRWLTQGTELASNGIGGKAQIWTKRDDGASTLAVTIDANQITEFTGQVRIANTSVTTNTTTGALYVAGGTGISGNINVGQGAIFNDSQASARDFIIRGDQDARLFWAYNNNSYNQVIIGNALAYVDTVVGAKLHINSTDAMILPQGTSAQRPGDTQGYGSAYPGMIRFNTVTADLEYYDGSIWFSPRTSALTVVTSQMFSGDGIELEYTLSRSATTNGCFVAINGVLQEPSVAYSVAGDVLTFTEAPAVGDQINIRTVTLTAEVRGLASPDGNVSVQAENAGYVFRGQNANAIVMLSEGTMGYRGTVQVSVGTSPTLIHSFTAATYRSAKYVIQVQNAAGGSFEVSEVMVIHDGTTAYRTQYNRVSTLANSAALGSVTTTYSSGTVNVYYTGASTGNSVKAKVELISASQPYLYY